MSEMQAGILSPIPRLARYLSFSLKPAAAPGPSLVALSRALDPARTVLGLGPSLLSALARPIEGLRSFPSLSAAGIDIPATPQALWCWLRGDDRGELLHRARQIETLLAPAFQKEHCVDAFQYGASLDLSGYEDGTENPQGERARQAAMVSGRGEALEGSSFVAVQQWVHSLDRLQGLSQIEQDHIVGRRKQDNEELDDAPASAHVKRTAQESFDPEAFVLRRSMPWADAQREGLMFVSFGHSVAAFEVLLNHMLGLDDGIVDGLFGFTRPISGAYYWCPAVREGVLDLSALAL